MKPKDPAPGDNEIREHVHGLLTLLGEDPNREGLRKTPERVQEAYRYLTKDLDTGHLCGSPKCTPR